MSLTKLFLIQAVLPRLFCCQFGSFCFACWILLWPLLCSSVRSFAKWTSKQWLQMLMSQCHSCTNVLSFWKILKGCTYVCRKRKSSNSR